MVTDASPSGLSAIVMQEIPGMEDRWIVAYACQALVDVERLYSQTETVKLLTDLQSYWAFLTIQSQNFQLTEISRYRKWEFPDYLRTYQGTPA